MDDGGDGLRAFAGFDWATQLHVVSLVDERGKSIWRASVADTGVGLEEMCDALLARSGVEARQIGIAIEVSRGRIVELLIERGFAVFGVNPKQLDRFRDRFGTAGAKSDEKDALVLASSLRTDRGCFRRLLIDEPVVVELREWSRELQDLGEESRRTSNQMRDHLRRYYPQLIDVTDDVTAPFMLDLVELAPTPARAQKLRLAQVAKVLTRHRIRKHTPAEVLGLLQQRPFFLAPGTVEGVAPRVRNLVARARVLGHQVADAQKNLERICASLAAPVAEDVVGQKSEHRDATILLSLAGIGPIVCATMLAEASQAIRERDYHALRLMAGVAPVTRSSGKSRGVLMRRACHERLREALFHWARVASQRDGRTKEHYAALRARGASHGRALRGVGDHLLNVACAMLREGTLYDPARRSPFAA